MNRQQATSKIANTYGFDAQSRQCMEEMAELTQVLNKFWREELLCGKKNLEEIGLTHNRYNIIEEIADVEIMLEQMKVLLKVPERTLKNTIDEKLERQLERMNCKY